MRHFEPRVKAPEKDVLDIPESLFMFFDIFVVYDNVYRSVIIVTLLHLGMFSLHSQMILIYYHR